MTDDDALERLSKKLDSKTPFDGVKRARLFSRSKNSPKKWQVTSEAPRPKRKPVFRMKTLEIFFVVSLVFFLGAVGIASYMLFSGSNTVSTKNVDVQVTGPTEIGAGSTLSLQVVVTNRNSVPMQLTDLIVEFPKGTRSDKDISRDLPRIRESIGTIEPGASINRTIRATIFGTAGSDLSIRASAEYRVPSSNGVFVADTVYVAKINQSPAAITIDALKEAVSGQMATFTVTVGSNAPKVLSDVVLVATYPPGFTFDSSSPNPVAGSAAWSLGDIEPGGKRTITVRGVFTGEDGDSRVVHFTAGSKKAGTDDQIVAPLATSDMALTITKPFISVRLGFLNGDIEETRIIRRGNEVAGSITWINNLPVRVQNVQITLALNGTILDRGSVKAQGGFYSSNNTSILWSKATNPVLADVAPGGSQTLTFSFNTIPESGGTFRNPELSLKVDVEGQRQSETNVPATVRSTASANLLVATDLKLLATLSHENGSYTNTGPIPPKADKETTYTVLWKSVNSLNGLANVSVSAVLPSYVRFISNSASANVSYNPSSRVVTWTVGDLSAAQSKNASFQIGLTPSLSQVGTLPQVIGNQRIYGFDRFVNGGVEGTAEPLTSISAYASPERGIVVP